MADINPKNEPDSLFREYLDAATSLYSAYEESESGALNILNNAIGAAELALASLASNFQEMARAESQYSNMLKSRFDLLGEDDDLYQSNVHAREALSLLDPTDPRYVLMQHNLALGLWSWFNLKDDRSALDESITLAESTVESTPEGPHRPDFLPSVSIKRYARYRSVGNLGDLNVAIEKVELALKISPQDHEMRAEWCSDLAISLESRFIALGNESDINRAVEVSRQAVELEPDDDAWLSNLGSNLESRYSWIGDPKDLEEAIVYARKSLEAASDHSPHLPTYLVSLGSKLQLRSEASGDGADADQALDLIRKGLDHRTAKRADRPLHLSMLASALANRYSRKSDGEDLLEANRILESLLVDASPTHPDRSAWTGSLCNNYSILLAQKRLRRHVTSQDLDRVISNIEVTLDSLPPNHSDRGPMCAALSTLLRARYNADVEATGGSMESGQKSDLELAISWMQKAIDHAGEDSLQWSTFERNLGMQKLALYNETHEDDQALLTSALGHLTLSIHATHATPLGKIEAIRAMIKILCLQGNFDEARIHAEEALGLLPQVCGRYRTLDDQQYAAMQTAGLAADCCSLALQAGEGHIGQALEQLESGRGVILGYLMDDHGGDYGSYKLDDGLDGDESLAMDLAEYERLRFMVSREITTQHEPAIRERLLEERKAAVEKLRICIDQLRRHGGYEMFLKGPKVEEMMALAADGPIVVVNVTDIGADAVIISNNALTQVLLPGMMTSSSASPSNMQARARSVMGYRGGIGTQIARDVGGEDNKQDFGDTLLPWLLDVCVEPIVGELTRLALAQHDNHHDPTRVWWIGSGTASSLPFHAASMLSVQTDSLGNKNNPAIISSYSTSVKALAHARRQATRPLQHDGTSDSATDTKTISVLVVTMTTTPNHNSLPGAEKEGRAVKQACSNIYECDILPSPNVDDVLSRIPKIDIFHFAGHGISDPRNALESHLLLQRSSSTDPQAKLAVDKLTLGEISAVSLHGPKAHSTTPRIAFLSACSTAEVQARKLADEGLHLAAAFQLAGFSHVIGSLWPADDSVCVEVAETFYTELIKLSTSAAANSKGGETNVSNKAVAVALHNAVSEAERKYGTEPYRWAPFIHLGP